MMMMKMMLVVMGQLVLPDSPNVCETSWGVSCRQPTSTQAESLQHTFSHNQFSAHPNKKLCLPHFFELFFSWSLSAHCQCSQHGVESSQYVLLQSQQHYVHQQLTLHCLYTIRLLIQFTLHYPTTNSLRNPPLCPLFPSFWAAGLNLDTIGRASLTIFQQRRLCRSTSSGSCKSGKQVSCCRGRLCKGAPLTSTARS